MKQYLLDCITAWIPLGCLTWLISGLYVHANNHHDKTSQILLCILCIIFVTTVIIISKRLKSFKKLFLILLLSFTVFISGQNFFQHKENITVRNLNALMANTYQENLTITINKLLYTSKKSRVYDIEINTFDLPARLTTSHIYHQNDIVYMNAYVSVKNNNKRIFVNVKESSLIKIKSNMIGLYSANLQNYFSTLYQKYLKDETLGIVEGIVLGMQTHIPFWFNNLFRDVGISHIIVLSGYNIVLVYEGLFLLLGRFISKNPITIISLLFAYMLVMVAGNSQASQRAYQSIMIHEGLRVLKILPSIEKTILYIVTAVVVATGEILISHVGLLLSCGATLGIVICMKLFNHLKRIYNYSRVATFIGSILVTTVGAWCGTLSLVIAFFGVATPSGMIMSILVMPLVFLYTVLGIGFLLLAMFEQSVPFIHTILLLLAWCFTKTTNIIMLVAVSVRYHIESISVSGYLSLIISLSMVIMFCIMSYITLPHNLFKPLFNNSKI